MSAPTFSVATPARNALSALRRNVGSVRGQTGVLVEHLVQDAASSDGSPAWLAAQNALPGAPHCRLRAVSEADASRAIGVRAFNNLFMRVSP